MSLPASSKSCLQLSAPDHINSMTANTQQFNSQVFIKYLGLPHDYSPSPQTDPIDFLRKHLHQLPPHLSSHFRHITSSKQRTTLAFIRNRRFQYVGKNPAALQFENARNAWPDLWTGRVDRRGIVEAKGKEEKEWAETDFLSGSKQHIGKLGGLLAEYERERTAERTYGARRIMTPVHDDLPEEDSDSDEGDSVPNSNAPGLDLEDTEESMKVSFERLVKERFVYGLLDNFDYDKVDWNEDLDIIKDREAQERWFDEDENN